MSHFRCILMNEDSMNYHVHHPCYADLPSPPPYPKDLRTEILMALMESVPIRSKLQPCLGVNTPKTCLVAMDWVGSRSGNETGCANFDPQNAQIGVLKNGLLIFPFRPGSPVHLHTHDVFKSKLLPSCPLLVLSNAPWSKDTSTEATTVFRRSPLDPIQ